MTIMMLFLKSQTKMMHHNLPMIMINFVNAWNTPGPMTTCMNDRQAMQRTLSTKFIFQDIMDSGGSMFLLQWVFLGW